MALNKILSILLLVFTVLLAKDPGNNEKIFGFEYFPLKNGTKSKFSTSIGKADYIVKSANKQYSIVIDGMGVTYTQNYYADQSGVYITKTENKALFTHNLFTYNKPLLKYPFPLKLNQTWNWSGIEYNDDNQRRLDVFGKVLGEETIITKTGKYNCLKVYLKLTAADGKVTQIYEWLAPNIGIVRQISTLQGEGIASILQKLFGLEKISFELIELNSK